MSVACRSYGTQAADAPLLRVGVGLGTSARERALRSLSELFYAEALLQREWDGRLTPRLVQETAWENQGRRLRIRLKPGVLLHDGTPLSAGLVAEQLERLIPKSSQGGAWGLAAITSLRAEDSDTLVVELSRPDIFLLAALSDIRIVKQQNADVGTGPFKITSRDPFVEAARFERYHADRPALGGVRIVSYDTQRAAWAALLRGEVDLVQEVSREVVEFIAGSSNVNTYSSLQPFYFALVFNHRHAAFRQIQVRKAVVEAIDRNEIVERIMRGRGRVADVPIWPMHWAYTPPRQPSHFDPDSARRRLDQLGYTARDASPRERQRSRFAFRCLVYNQDPEHERIALMIQRQLSNVGIDMQIELVPYTQLETRMARGQFDAFLARANASRTLERTYQFWHSATPERSPDQDSGYTGADALLDHLRASTSDDEVRRMVAALAERFHEDAPAAFIAWIEVTRAVSARFGVPDGPNQDPLANLQQLQVTPVAR